MRPDSKSHLNQASKWDTAGVLLDEAAASAGLLDLPALFGNARPVELEIGSGKGTFLLARAAARADLNFLGLEWARAYCHYTADRIRRAGLGNVRMLRAEAGAFCRTCLPGRSIWRLHVYFPDPWPKRRHHHRRLIQPAFLDEVKRILRPGGQFIIVTDHLGYFSHIQRVMAEARGFASTDFPRMTGNDGEIVGTNFERKYIGQGRSFYWRAFMRYE